MKRDNNSSQSRGFTLKRFITYSVVLLLTSKALALRIEETEKQLTTQSQRSHTHSNVNS